MAMAREGVSATLEAVITSAVRLIEGGEEARGPITRAQCARLVHGRNRAQELLAGTV
ncbi:hypothetical protein [Sphingomonas sp. RIT328]|uniref:hypothetical protein n=1 Tax=Sphingomonas sp. RIT328 TaxID=1470591 RepID=UPI0004473692|nr:hypothetical protein [Sphingomonas sp. RIT328]EZP50837.1 hypothetical protein BW41_03088 [Sphingomonas sp. RIT328]